MADNTQEVIRRARMRLAQAGKKKDIDDIKEDILKALGEIEPIKEFYGKISRTELIKIKGDRGEDGYTPIKGKDYYTPEEIKEIKKEVTPVKGKDYFDGKDGKSIVGPRGPIGPRGPRGLKGEPGENGKSIKGPKGDKGEDGSPDTPYEIRDKLSSLRGNERLDAKAIKNLAKEMGSVTFTGMGGGTSQTVTEHIADTLIHVPIYIQDTAPSNPSLNDLWIDTSV